MSDSDLEAKLSIPFDVKGIKDLDSAGDNLEKLRDALTGATAEVRNNSAALRSLRGTSDEVKAARAALKGAIDAERDSMSAAQLKIIKMGTTYEALVGQVKKAELEERKLQKEMQQSKAVDEQKKQLDALRQAVAGVGGPLESLSSGLEKIRSLFSAGNMKAVAMTVGIGLLALGLAALSAALVYGIVELAKWTAESANAMRAMALMREASSGSAANAAALGSQVDALARKLPLSTAALNDMAAEITATFSGTQLSGQGIVDTFKAVAGASAAMGDQVGKQLQEIIDRGKQWGRVGIGRFELQGTGLQFDDLAKHVAIAMHTTVQNARMQLLYGMVPVNQAAAALRDTVNARFGEINAKKMLDLSVIAQKFGDRLRNLTKGFDLSPVLEGLEKLSDMFDASTVTGDALKQMIGIFGKALGATFKGGVPIVQRLFETLIIWTQRAVIAGLKFALVLRQHRAAIGLVAATVTGVLLGALGALVPLVWSLASAVLAATWPFVAVGAAIGAVGYALYELVKRGDQVKSFFSNLATAAWDAGKAMLEGLLGGIESMWSAVIAKIKGLGQAIKNTFAGKLQIRSPSKVFERYGEQTTAGYVEGVEGSAPKAGSAAAAMAPLPRPASAGAGGGASSHTEVRVGAITVTVQMGAGADGKAVSKGVAQNLKAELLAVLEGLGSTEGIPMQAVAT